MTIKILPTALLYLFYCGISTFIFMLTTGGWFIIIEIYLAPILPVFGFILLVTRLFRARVMISKKIFRRIILFLLFFQLLAVLTNYGNCGDVVGGYNFIQKLFAETIGRQRFICNLQNVEAIIPLGVVILIRLIYYFVNLAFAGMLIFSSQKNPPYRG